MNAAKRSARKCGWCLSALALLLLGTAGSSRAQDVELPTPKTWSVKVGTFLPTNGGMMSQSNTPWWSVGADYYTATRYRPFNADLYLSATFNWRDDGGSTFFTLPLTAKLLWQLTPVEMHPRVYSGIGAGIWFINARDMSGTTQPGLTFVLGADLTSKLFVEANYDYVSGFTNNLGVAQRVDGVRVMAGYRY